MGLSLKTLRKEPTEAEFTRQVIDLARLHGWRTAHFRAVAIRRKNGSVYYETPVQGDGAGWPDLILVKGCRIIAAELKVGRNKVSPEQTEWLLRLGGAGVHSVIWRPEMWAEIERVLSA